MNANEVMTSMQVVRILRRPPEDRAAADVALVAKWFQQQKHHFFLKDTANSKENCKASDVKHQMHYSRLLMMDLCSQMMLEVYENGHTICRQGDRGDTFYVILEGCMNIFIKRGVDGGALDPGEPVRSLYKGMGFGELALEQKDSLRKATAIASGVDDEKVYLAAIDRDTYTRCVYDANSSKSSSLEERMKFLRQLAIFKSWDEQDLLILSYSLKEMFLPRNKSVFVANADANNVYIVISGEVKLSRPFFNVEESRHQTKKLPPIEIEVVKSFGVFGDVDVWESRTKYTYTARTSAETCLFVLPRHKYRSLVVNSSEKTQATVANAISLKAEWYDQRVDFAQSNPDLKIEVTVQMQSAALACNLCNRCGCHASICPRKKKNGYQALRDLIKKELELDGKEKGLLNFERTNLPDATGSMNRKKSSVGLNTMRNAKNLYGARGGELNKLQWTKTLNEQRDRIKELVNLEGSADGCKTNGSPRKASIVNIGLASKKTTPETRLRGVPHRPDRGVFNAGILDRLEAASKYPPGSIAGRRKPHHVSKLQLQGGDINKPSAIDLLPKRTAANYVRRTSMLTKKAKRLANSSKQASSSGNHRLLPPVR
jgi:CRP-like cAMP-binding protein